jgi:ribosomal protein S18 acetylase RimI-like enzyme
MGITVHTGNAGDIKRVFPMFYRQLEERAAIDPDYFALRPDAQARFRQWVGPALEDPRHALVVAEEGGQFVGCLVVTLEQDLPIFVHDEYAAVRVLCVDPRYGGRGIARQMLDQAARECGLFGLRQLRASAAVAREIEKHVLKKAGFRAAGVTFLRNLPPAAAETESEADSE